MVLRTKKIAICQNALRATEKALAQQTVSGRCEWSDGELKDLSRRATFGDERGMGRGTLDREDGWPMFRAKAEIFPNRSWKAKNGVFEGCREGIKSLSPNLICVLRKQVLAVKKFMYFRMC
jgi:hypothetical protein